VPLSGKRVLVVGLGRFGTALVETLWRGRAEVVAVDPRPEAVENVKDRTSHAYIGDGTSVKVLEGVGAQEMDAAVVTFGMSFESMVLCVASLKRMEVPYILARAETPRQAEILRTVGATRVMQIEAEMGQRLGRDLLTPVAAELLDLVDDYRVVAWVARGELVGRTLANSELRQRYELTVLGCRRASADGETRARLVVPTPDYVIREGDTLLLVGEDQRVADFFTKHARA
jgi:trk system potassium uptake protein TrkA